MTREEQIWNETNYFQNGNSSQCVKCVWHSVDELPMFDRGENGDMTPFIVDSYYGHIGGVAHSYTRVTWKNHIDTHRNREFMWAYESDLFPINCKKYIEQGCRAESHPQWIPVEERLPKERGQYFVYTAAVQSWQSEWMQDFKGVWRWYASPVVLGIIANVTHWMEIVPPKEGGDHDK